MSPTAWLILALACLGSWLGLILFLGLTGYVFSKGTQAIAASLKKAAKAINSPLPPTMRQALQEARQYGQRIIKIGQESAPRQQRMFGGTLAAVEMLLDNLTKLEENLEQLYSRRNLTVEMGQTSAEIVDLQQQAQRVDGKRAAMMKNLLTSKKKHHLLLEDLQSFQQQIELTIRQNAAILNSIHAEIMLLAAKNDLDNKHFHRLNAELQENSASLNDLLETLDEMEQERYVV